MFSLPVTYYAYSRTHANFSHTICCIASFLNDNGDREERPWERGCASGLLRGRFRDVTHRSHATLPKVLRNVPKTAAMETTSLGIVQL